MFYIEYAGEPAEVPAASARGFHVIQLESIGLVRNTVKQPRPDGWERVESWLELRPELAAATDGLALYSHITVVFAMHLVPADRRALRLRLAPSIPEQGVLATRSQLRPNPIGVSTV